MSNLRGPWRFSHLSGAPDILARHIKALGKEHRPDPIGNLDGVEPNGQGCYLVDDWFRGALYNISEDVKATW